MSGLSSSNVMDVGTNNGRGWNWPDADPLAVRSRLKTAKLWVLRRAQQVGFFRFIRDSTWRSKRLLILGYHGISLTDEHKWSPELYMPPAALRARFEMIRDNGYTVLPLREAIARLQAGTLPPRSVALTFDDGMYDFLVQAVPILQEFKYPATVYVSTYYAQKQVPIFRVACRYMLWTGRDRSISGEGLTLDGGTLHLQSSGNRDAIRNAIETRLDRLGRGVAEEVATLQRLAERVGIDYDSFVRARLLQIMTPDEIRSLPADIDVQLHTHRHRVPVREPLFLREIEENRTTLASWRQGETLDAFCYPSGVTDARFLPWLRDLQVKTGVTCDPGMVTETTEPLLLPRLVDSTGMTRLEFEAWLSGAGSLIPRMRTREDARLAPVND